MQAAPLAVEFGAPPLHEYIVLIGSVQSVSKVLFRDFSLRTKLMGFVGTANAKSLEQLRNVDWTYKGVKFMPY